nr:HNH endonuclease signature motif containing protein [Paenibacillus polymyxa]
MASIVFENTIGNYANFTPQEWVEGLDFLPKAFKPHKRTLLHDYISDLYYSYFEYPIDKHLAYEPIENIIDLFKTYDPENSEYHKLSQQYTEFDIDKDNLRAKDKLGQIVDDQIIDNLGYSLLSTFRDSIMPTVVDDIFTVLFQSKSYLRHFNVALAEVISAIKVEDEPGYLKRDGVIQRCTYIPSWLKQAVFYRDKGKCQECGKDVSGLLDPANNYHIDHIVPLDMGGTNDPTNFQLLCSTCNLSKGARTNHAFDIEAPFWEQD